MAALLIVGSVVAGTVGDRSEQQETSLTTAATASSDEATSEAAAGEDASRAAEEEASRKAAEEEQRRAEEEAQRKAEEEAQRKAEEEAQRKAEEEAAAEAARLDPGTYAAISDRDWALVERDPDSHAGKKYVLYGYVTQFDSNTGPSTFRANTGGEAKSDWYDYDVNTIVSAEDPSILANVVTDDMVKMYVEVVSSFSYDTTMGGSMTVPLVQVNVIEVTGGM
ncbi:hypothetical protein KZX45_05780 [Georgenia sp. EYE_87]|uniref:hypothetical protein n=1 Tax=Georgenia sp. EYE_87 TaxID=2853448 RepID=UPI002003001D|nr:hypothetical protein [Georgenia sp. EYE_87]MCK6210050.1 hypothetical protein [Georgenia sp. EYE_87]